MTFDFRATQLRTSKFIASGSTGTNAKLLLYPIAADGTPSNQGNINTAVFGTGSIGQDVFLFVSGGINAVGGTTGSVALFGGDLVSSGNIKAIGRLGFTDNIGFLGSIGGVLSANRTYLFPDAAGTVLLTTQVIAGDGIAVVAIGLDSIKISSSYATGSGTPLGLGTATAGTSSFISKEDHVHPTTSAGTFVHTGFFTVSGSAWFSGSLTSLGGLSGSHQRLADGTPAFVAGDNITITTQSNGAIAISGSVNTWTPSLASMTGWTDVSLPDGSVAISGGTLTGSVTGSVAATIVGAATIPWGSTDCYDVRARIQISGDTTANAKAHLRINFTGGDVILNQQGNGTLLLIGTIGGYVQWASVVSRPIDGTGWVRVRIVGQRVSAWYGTGVGVAAPTATGWTLLHDADQVVLVSQTGPVLLHLGGQTEGGALTTDTNFLWSSVSARKLDGTL